MPFTDYALQGMMPAVSPWLAKTSAVSLPVGGQVGLGIAYPQGQALGYVGGAAATEVRTLTITANGATGLKGYFLWYTPDRAYAGITATGGVTANLVTAFPTAAQLQAALYAAIPPWNGNVAVTGAVGGPYTFTFGNLLASRRIGGLFQFVVSSSTGGTPTGAITTATQGSSGPGQADLYSQASNNYVDGFLQYAASPGALGSELTEFGTGDQAKTGYTIWSKGIFAVGNIGDATNPQGPGGAVGLDANAMTLKKLAYHFGQTLSDVGVLVELL